MTGQITQFAAALCAGAGAWLLADGSPWRRRSRLLPVGAAGAAPSARRRRPMTRPPDAATVRVVLGCLAVGGLLALWGRSALPLAAALLAAPLVARWWRGCLARRAADQRRDAVIALCASLAGEVRAGRPPGKALADVGTGGLGVPGGAVLAAARYGGDVPSALRAASERPGAEGLRGLAACWAVAVDGGASLASGLERVAGALRAERDQQEELRAQLAGPRATALVLAALPLFGLALGATMGVEPLRVLFGTPAGLGCLLVGALLEWAGVAWVRAIVRSAERGAA
ncbi:type II secretion system F family protein [Streptomyces sp. NBC_01803]|uniref:type II secretion system F family protein n=1 Tax=Streptomyces sp. NBC_01803 TaxID=2975946 RepID=UPI002DD9AEC4|nr:type II secretion system F family protein [Streptomyces sp. NBC_01803]WSA45499.1 type II secretion system F family protein [Streptomyces sp. NBC_01803]